jgi:phosphatidylinositol alpha-1,6-mannosyltransferase
LKRPLTLVTAGLELDGGGRAVVGRLLAHHLTMICRDQGRAFEVLSFGAADPLKQGARTHGFSRARLALAVLTRQMKEPRGLWLYDLLGLARVQAWSPVRAPYGVVLYGIEVWRPLGRAVARALDRAASPIAISHATIEGSRSYTSSLERAFVLPLTLEDRPAHGEIDLGALRRAGEGFVLIAGRMGASERYKGHDELLEALARPEARGVRMVVAGGGDDRERLEQRAAELAVADRVTFTGFVSEATLAELYRRAAVLAMPSRGEGFGLVYLEAMRAGKPVIAARGGAAEEVVVDRGTGRLVDPGDRHELAAALLEATGDKERASSWGAAGRQRWHTHFSSPAFTARVTDWLDALDRCAA